MANIELKRYNGSGYDTLYPVTDWALVNNKPSTYTPTSHTHGGINNSGQLSGSPTAVASGDYLLIADASATYAITQSNIALGSSTTTFLRNDGSWATPSGTTTLTSLGVTATAAELNVLDGITASVTELNYTDGVTSSIQTQLNAKASVVKGYKASSTSATTTTPTVVFTTGTLEANSYYNVTIYGTWSKVSSGTACAPVITMAVDNTTGTPTWSGLFTWLNTPTASTDVVEGNSASITTTTTTLGFAPSSSTSTIASTQFAIEGVLYTGTTTKTLSLYVANTSSNNPVYVDKAYCTAIKVN